MTASRWHTRGGRYIAATLVGVLAAGCAEPAPPDLPRLFTTEPVDPNRPGFYRVDPMSKYATFDADLAASRTDLPRMDHADFAMVAANHAVVDEVAGDLPGAFRAAMDSQRVMTGVVSGEEGKAAAAVMADESYKVFKGECYEIAMVNCLLGLYSLRMGDPETAAIGFRRAVEADKMSEQEYRDDFRLAFWGLGMAAVDSDRDAAAVAFRKCEYKPPERVAEENLVVLVSMGRAPWKRLAGIYGEYDEFVMESYEPRSAEIIVDGRSLGRAVPMINLFQQSEGVPRTGKDVGQGAKAVGKAAVSMALGAFLGRGAQDAMESAWSVKADTRTCYMLPNEVHVLTAKLPAGLHTIRVKFRDRAGTELPRYEQVWHYVQVPAGGRNYLAVRSEFDRCNVQGPIPFTRISKVKTDKRTEATTLRFRASNLPGVGVGDTLQVCHFYRMVENRWDMQYHWRYAPMAYNGKGEPIGYPGCRPRMRHYDIGLIGEATVTEIDGDEGFATMRSLTTEYLPQTDDMVTAARKQGRLWR